MSDVLQTVLWSRSRPEPDFLAGAGAGVNRLWLQAVAVWLRGTVVAK